MGLTVAIARSATGRVHVLIVEIPGYSLVRMHVEASITARGWVLAQAPADADVLLMVGVAGDAFHKIADYLWNQIPSPRHRTSITTLEAIPSTLDAIPTVLRDHQQQSRDALQRPQHVMAVNEKDMDMRMDMDMSMDMSGPAGIPLASGDESDRDGLEMDVTHLTLGPVLPHWPAGLVVHCTLHGDAIGEAALEVLPGAQASELFAGPPNGATAQNGSTSHAAVLCDAAGSLLHVAGWGPVAVKIQRVRDGLLTGNDLEKVTARLHRVSRQLARSRTLRWSLAGIASNDDVDARRVLLGWLRAATALAGEQALPQEEGLPSGSGWPQTVDDVRNALVGQELSAARLVLACIEPSRRGELGQALHE